MKYDFTTIIDRKEKDAMALDAVGSQKGHVKKPTFPKEGFSIIPMWVADMNFATAPSVMDALNKRIAHPLLVISIHLMIIMKPSCIGRRQETIFMI